MHKEYMITEVDAKIRIICLLDLLAEKNNLKAQKNFRLS